MLYAQVHDWLGWPTFEDAFAPSGAGAKMYVDFARKKIVGAMELQHPGVQVNVGIIPADPNSDGSEAPLALLCEFPRGARNEVLDLAHSLAWNFCRTAILITLEPHRLIAWSCYRDPSLLNQRRICELEASNKQGLGAEAGSVQGEVRDLLHWVNLINHRAQRVLPELFPADGRADALLLKNLRYVRRELIGMGLAREYCHDLLARVIFTQFLFHRKDSDGNAFFSARTIRRLFEEGVLAKQHHSLDSVLSSKRDTYSLFQWMDVRFNGDLFPGKEGQTEKERGAAWKSERKAVSQDHLNLLSGLIRGDLDVPDKQHTLWPYYSFDTIPLEFVSSVYEEFLTADERQNDKAYYTPSHLVDYVLDAVLPWNDQNWNVRILDPCCGSAIFLVKAFQRLIHRWRLANPNKDPLVSDLRPILEGNLVGVDENSEAVRVACFSLYLAMADAIEPKHYVTRENVKVFPRLRGTRLISCDFFDENTERIRTTEDESSYDLVLGNAPWGDGSIRRKRRAEETNAEYRHRLSTSSPSLAQDWAKRHSWPVANNDIGPLFLAKSASLAKPGGRVAMVNTASLLYWRDGQASCLRQKLFSSFTFDEITNLSALRREMFAEAIGPACVVVFGKEKPKPETTLYYFTPKPNRLPKRDKRKPTPIQGVVIEPDDVNTLTHYEAENDSFVWPLLALGKRRDLALVRRLMALPSLGKLKSNNQVITRLGVIPGDRKKRLPEAFKNRRYFDDTQFPDTVFLDLDSTQVPAWGEPVIDGRGSTDFEAFKKPQLLVKQSFSASSLRFRAAIVSSPEPEWGVICKKTYLSVRDLDLSGSNIQTACAVYNSRLAAYFLGLTSSRIGHYITETLSEELLSVPLPPSFPDISKLSSFEEIDDAVCKAFALTPADRHLIDDFLDFTLPDALRKTPGASRVATRRTGDLGEPDPELASYAETFIKVIKATFGADKKVGATIFSDDVTRRLPVRMLTLHLDSPKSTELKFEPMNADGLLDQLAKFHIGHLKKKARDPSGEGLGFQRVAYFFHRGREGGGMNLTLVKPDECRYWTRSSAMRDADQLACAIAKAAQRAPSKRQ